MKQSIKLFIIFALLLFAVIGYKTYEQYHRIEDTQKLIIQNESQSLAEFISAFRQTYQDIFLHNHITVNEKTINLLPVKTTRKISDHFSSSVQGDVIIRTVSDRPRNINNMANDFELKMIQYFKKNPNETYKFIQKNNVYHYIKPLFIKESCLKCHGKRENAIPSIRDKYENAYDYKLGDIRGLLDIQIKERGLFSAMYSDFTDTLISTVFLYIVFLIIIYILIRKIHAKEEQYTQQLETDIKTKTYEIKKQKDTFQTLFEKSSDGILIIDNGKFIQCNEKIMKMFHYDSKEEMLNLHPSDLSPEFQADGHSSYEKAEEMITLAREKGGHQFEWVHVKANGEKFLAEVTLTPIILNDRNVVYVTVRDISEKKKAQKELLEQKNILHYQAYHDALTGLPNRILFNERLRYGIEQAKKNKTKIALFFIDLDHFKQINDSLGHQVGDKVLIAVTKRLKSKIRKKDTLARLGGDEFTIIMEDFNKIQDASLLAKKILRTLAEPMHIDNHILYVSGSIGISIYTLDYPDIDNLIKYADAAMYKAKEEGRNNFQFYSSEMTTLAFERVAMEAKLHQALKKEEFVLYYQPQIDANSGELLGMEALIRWQHPTMGLLFPETFISLAEETGLIVEIDKWVIKTAMKQIYKWYQEGFTPGILAVNLSMRQFRSNDFIQILQENIMTINFKPEWLELEVPEGQMMQKPEETIHKLEQISAMGIAIAIDDFGTGYSSLAYLERLPVNTLKIDQSFVRGIPKDKEDIAIIKSIIALAKSLKLNLIAEGVETDAQKKFLLDNGCKTIQGYYYSKPIPANEIKEKYLI